jgi:hypothetical protein
MQDILQFPLGHTAPDGKDMDDPALAVVLILAE